MSASTADSVRANGLTGNAAFAFGKPFSLIPIPSKLLFLAGLLSAVCGQCPVTAPEAFAGNRIETLAGGGPVGDHGPAALARFNLPGGVAEAPNGDLIVVVFGNHRVRRIDHVTGIVETIAGTGEAGYNGDDIPARSAQ